MALLAGCVKNELVPVQNSDETITLTLSVRTPEASPMTKTMGEKPDITNLYIAIFDQGGYPVSYVQTTELTQVDASTWNYKVSLPTSGDSRTLHFIANSPISSMDWEYEDNIIGNLVTTGNNDAYWQKIVLEDGIQTLEQVKPLINNISLVRNFAKVTVQSAAGSNFTLSSMKVFNVPSKGYVAPKYEEGSFVEGYNSITLTTLKSTYKGRTPEDATMVTDFDEDDLIAAVDGVASDYMYERPIPTGNAPFMIVYGQYDTGSYYYKIDLQDADDNYYPILRNFVYKVNIKSVRSAGCATIEEAIASQGTGNITTETEYENVTNIGYGKGRLFVDKIGVTVQKAGAITLKYKFIPNVDNNIVVNTPGSSFTTTTPVSLTLSDPLIGTANAVTSSIDVATSDVDGWRTVTLTAVEPDPVYLKQQELIVVGKAVDGSLLQRKILITVAPTFKLDVQCPKKVKNVAGQSVTVTIGLQSGLPESIFPVAINIETKENTLDPGANEALPVATGRSLSGDDSPAYMFVRTISWDEYQNASSYEGTAVVNDKTMPFTFKSIDCNFVTNVAESASAIWIGGNTYFNNDSCSFLNDGDLYEFSNISFSEALLGSTGKTTDLSFNAPYEKDITITLTNGTWDGKSNFTYHAKAGSNTISGIALNTFGSGITVKLSDGDEEYYEKSYTGYRTALIPENSLAGTIKSLESLTANSSTVTIKGGLEGSENTNMTFLVTKSNGVVDTIYKPKHDVATKTGTQDRAPRLSASYDEATNLITINIESNYNSGNMFYRIGNAPDNDHRTQISSQTFTIDWSERTSGTIYVARLRDRTYRSSTVTVTDNSTTTKVYGYYITGPTTDTKILLTGNVTENTLFNFKWMYNGGANTMTATTMMENISTETTTLLFE